MYQSITRSQFMDAFNSIRPGNFTYDGLSALFDYLEDCKYSTGEQLELDVIALCCEYVEYEDLQEMIDQYSYSLEIDLTDVEEEDKEEETKKQAMEYFQDNTQVIEVEKGGYIIQAF